MYTVCKGGVLMARVQCIIKDDLLKEIDKQAKSLSISRSAYMSLVMSKELIQTKTNVQTKLKV